MLGSRPTETRGLMWTRSKGRRGSQDGQHGKKIRVGLEMWLRGEYLPGMHHILAPIPNTGRK